MTRTYKIRGKGDPILPIEDWAKGITKAFSKRKSHSARSIILEQSTPTSMVTKVPSEHESDLLSLRTRSFATIPPVFSRHEASATLPSEPTEDWMEAIPLQKPILQPRNSRRSPLFVASTAAQPSSLAAEYTESSSSSSSLDMRIGWQIDADSERSIPDQVQKGQLNQHANTISEMCRVPEAYLTQDVMLSSSSSQDPQKQSYPAEFIMGVENLSLRSLFFGSTQAPRDRLPRWSIASSSSSNYTRSQSIASSTTSFATANEFTVKDAEQIEVLEELVTKYAIGKQIESEILDTSAKPDSFATSGFPPQYDADTGIDEDYSTHGQGTTSDVAIENLKNVTAETTEVATNIEDSAGDQADFEHCIPGDGSLADILFQIAMSSPYSCSDSEDTSSLGNTSALDQAEASSQSDLDEDFHFDRIRDPFLV